MPPALHDEKRNFLFFLLLLLATVILFSFAPSSPLVRGLLGLAWGFFGFCRLLFLYHPERMPAILTLSSRILFGLEERQEEERAFILKRLGQSDVAFFFIAGGTYVLWALCSSFFPADITEIVKLHSKQEALLEVPVKDVLLHNIVMAVCFYAVIAIITFLALSFSYDRMMVKKTLYFLFPVFIIGSLFSFLILAKVSSVLWPDLSIMKGAGLGQAGLMLLLTPEMMEESGSFLIGRFIQTGAIGSIGLYVLIIPALFYLIKMLKEGTRTPIIPAIGLVTAALLALMDILLIYNNFSIGSFLLGWVIVVLCWGKSGYRRCRDVGY